MRRERLPERGGRARRASRGAVLVVARSTRSSARSSRASAGCRPDRSRAATAWLISARNASPRPSAMSRRGQRAGPDPEHRDLAESVEDPRNRRPGPRWRSHGRRGCACPVSWSKRSRPPSSPQEHRSRRRRGAAPAASCAENRHRSRAVADDPEPAPSRMRSVRQPPSDFRRASSDRRVLRQAAKGRPVQMMIGTVPPSALQAAPVTYDARVGAQEDDHGGDLLRLGEPPERPAGADLREHLVARRPAGRRDRRRRATRRSRSGRA